MKQFPRQASIKLVLSFYFRNDKYIIRFLKNASEIPFDEKCKFVKYYPYSCLQPFLLKDVRVHVKSKYTNCLLV